MEKKEGRRFEVELDWYYISKETVRKGLIGFVIAAIAVSGGVYYWLHRGDNVPRRAAAEIAAAEQLLSRARALPDAARMKEEADAAAGKVGEARASYEAGRFPEALNSAVEARSLAQRLLGGSGSSRHDAAIMDFGGKVEVQRASRATWEPARTGMKLYEGDFLKTGANGLAGKSYDQIVAAPETRTLLQGYIDTVNKDLAKWETIKKFAILPKDLTVEAGELTPSLKVKRKAVEKKYNAVLDEMYAGAMADV